MYPHFIKWPLLLVVFLFSSTFCHAQIGIKVSELSPYGDIGEYFNKGPAIDAYCIFKEGRWRERLGLSYSHLSPRIDTVPVYLVKYDASNNTQTVIPGFLANHTLTFEYITGDFSYRMARLRSFCIYVGAGIVAGKSHTEYNEVYKSVIVDHSNKDVLIAGFKACSSIEYKVSKHLDVYAEYTYNGIVSNSWSTRYTNTLFSIGIDYSIKPFDDK